MRRKMMDTLLAWKKQGRQRPLVLTGAGQTGKTWLAREFGGKYFAHTAYVNLESDLFLQGYFQKEADPTRILEFLEVYVKVPIREAETLIILDDFHACPKVRNILGRFAGEYPGLAILAVERLSGRAGLPPLAPADVQVEPLFPLDFEEFLWAAREAGLARSLKECGGAGLDLGSQDRDRAAHLWRVFRTTGGLPAPVMTYREERSLLGVPDCLQKAFRLDLAEIASAAPAGLRTSANAVYQSLSRQLLKENPCFQYRTAQKGSTRKGMEGAIRWLVEAGLVIRVPEAFRDGASRFRLYHRDAGLCLLGMGLPPAAVFSFPGEHGFDRLEENQLAAVFQANGYALSYWSSGNKAGLPFLLEKEGKKLAVDIKLDPHKKSRSAVQFRKQEPDVPVVRLTLETQGEGDGLQLLPDYLAFCL